MYPLLVSLFGHFLKRSRTKSKEQKKYCVVTFSLPTHETTLSISPTFFLMVFLSNENVSSERLGYSRVLFILRAFPESIFVYVVLTARSGNDCTDCRDALQDTNPVPIEFTAKIPIVFLEQEEILN